MGEIMRAIPFDQLIEWAMQEYAENNSVFGIKKEKMYAKQSGGNARMFGEPLGSLVGPAAGPNTQLAQNIIAAYLTGARFMELKTVQVIDGEDLRKAVARPCIDAQDEGYNVEWSTELTVEGAMNEYVKAWLAIHVLMAELELGTERDFIFNMSVGYDLKGIQSEKIDRFIEGMRNASETEIWKSCMAYLKNRMPAFSRFDEACLAAVSPAVSNSITLSTLHGCPPQEIERIAMYLLTEKNIHTYIKCNPTLLGYERARKLMDDMGYGYVQFDDHHFNNDLQLQDAVPMLRRLKAVAAEKGKEFGVKITNTFPVQNDGRLLPGEEKYMSGRSLFPLSVNVAQVLSEAFDGALPISFSGGADYFNINELIDLGIRPVTVATTILKPGGYSRFKQLAEATEKKRDSQQGRINIDALTLMVNNMMAQVRHKKDARDSLQVKTKSRLPLFDCYKAPCQDGGCPIHQQIPQYVNLADRGEYERAFQVIAVDNALPSVTGTLCNHNCQSHCTRNHYEDPVQIRNTKLTVAEQAQDAYISERKPCALKTKQKAVVIGAGPAGISVALFLRRNGMEVTVLEKNDGPFGIIKYVIPSFRIADSAMERDYQMAVASGIDFQFGVSPDYRLTELKQQYDYVVLATGAWKEGICPVKKGGENMIDALAFLADSKKQNCNLALGKRVAVIGAGDVAMDCARAAKRAPDVEEVIIVYRRTREFMPAIPEEIRLALEDGVQIRELLAPVEYDNRMLTCEVQELTDELDASGRRLMQGTGRMERLQFDTVIGAVGARVDTGAFAENKLRLNERQMPVVTAENESSMDGVYIAGDCKAGAATIVEAIADAKAIAKAILQKAGLTHDFVPMEIPESAEGIYSRRGILKDKKEQGRCLSCNQICEICTEVCPNRANVSIAVKNGLMEQGHQILHIDGMCNECGNCGTFCPHTGNPYKDKMTLFWTAEDFEDSHNIGFLPMGNERYQIRCRDGSVRSCPIEEIQGVFPEMASVIEAVESKYPYFLVHNVR